MGLDLEPRSRHLFADHWYKHAVLWLAVWILLAILHYTAKQSMISEIRTHVMGVAIATAAGVDHHDLERIHSAHDMKSEFFTRVQSLIFAISSFNPDVRYIYIMRRVQGVGAMPWQYKYVVDQPAEDTNGNGIIDADEATEPTGTPYDASGFPFMITAWEKPCADNNIAPDPPYPDLLSGYAPIKNERGETVAIVGVDITASTISKKLFSIKLTILLVGALISGLLSSIVHLREREQMANRQKQVLADEVTNRNRELEKALHVREDLSHMIVHDMRHHLSIITMASGLKENGNTTDGTLNNMELIRERAQQMNEFCNDMLLVAKMDDDKLILHCLDADIHALVRDVVTPMRAIAHTTGIHIELDLPDEESGVHVKLDITLTRRLLDNLISNAIKFSPTDSTVTIRVEAIHARPIGTVQARMRIKVIDQGPGIDEKEQLTIFDRFHVIDTKPPFDSQIGLGLALCKIVADAHGGRIFVQSNKPQGAIFIVEL